MQAYRLFPVGFSRKKTNATHFLALNPGKLEINDILSSFPHIQVKSPQPVSKAQEQ